MGYNDLIVQSGLLQLNPALARDVKQITEYFANCVRLSQERTLHSDEGDIGSEGTSAQQSRTGTSVNSEGHIQRSTTTPEQEQTWNLTVWSQSPGPKSARAIATQSESYLAHISRTSYSLPEPSNQSIAIRQYSYSVAELQDQSRSGDVNQLRPSDDQDQQGDSLPFSFIDDPSHGQSSVAPPNVLPVDLPAIGAEFLPGRQRSQRSHYLPETPVISRTLSPKYTYSYKDVTFAQTLLRATVEVGFRLLYNPAVHPAVLNYVFRLSLPYLSLEDLRKRSKTSLFPGATEEQDWNATPFLHLGGAGTHYQRLDAQGMLIPMENSWTVRQIGPLERNTIRTENVTDGRIQDLEGVDIGGFEGKWFDSYDVQGYLEERWHCRINPKSSFAECLIDDEDTSHSHGSTECASLNLESTATNPNYATPPGPVPQAFNAFEPSSGLDMPVRIALASTFLPPPPKHNLLGLSFDQTLGLDLAPDVDLGFVGSSGFNLAGLNTMGEAEQLPVVKQKAKRVALVDVQKLIDSESGETLIKHNRAVADEKQR